MKRPPIDPARAGQTLTHVTVRAMATRFTAYLPAHEPSTSVDAVVEAMDELPTLESKWTIYDPHSEISRINRGAGDRAVVVSPLTIELLQSARRWFDLTGGAFDVTAGPLIEAWGFTRRTGRKPDDDEIQRARELVGGDRVEIDPDTRKVYLPMRGMTINTGSIGKGVALDRIANRLVRRGVDHFLIHGGASSVIARGDQTHVSDNAANPSDDPANSSDDAAESSDRPTSPNHGWIVNVAHPHVVGQTLATTHLHNAAMGTSGNGKQFFHYRGRRYGHVIDPRTGRPTGDAESISLVCDGATDADAAATGMFVMGIDAIDRWMSNDPPGTDDSTNVIQSAAVVTSGRRQNEVELKCYGDFASDGSQRFGTRM